MLFTVVLVLLAVVGIVALASVILTIDICVRYLPTVERIFEEQPFFVTLDGEAAGDAEDVSFPTTDGLRLRGSYWKTLAPRRRGAILFCHEFLSDRWSARLYCEALRRAGFDILGFDFRNHGQSDGLAGYEPLQWVTEYEVADVRAAFAYLRGRADMQGWPIGLFGVSRGGGAGWCASASMPAIRAIATDGAFPTSGTQVYYMRRWARIYSKLQVLFARLPQWYLRMLAWLTRRRVGRRRGCRFSSIERAVGRLRSRPLLMIHGEKDNYIVPEIVQELHRRAGPAAQLWIVPHAKHNQCLQVAEDEYRERVVRFFTQAMGGGEAEVLRVESELGRWAMPSLVQTGTG